jgi:hypothetical protein
MVGSGLAVDFTLFSWPICCCAKEAEQNARGLWGPLNLAIPGMCEEWRT